MPHSHQTLDWPENPISARVVIGVTGHRDLMLPEAVGRALSGEMTPMQAMEWVAKRESDLVKCIHEALQKIKALLPRLAYTPLVFDILSPLAEGADRLVAHEVLKGAEAHLYAVLPMPDKEYLDDFDSAESKEEFKKLLDKARHKWRLHSSGGEKTEAYKQVGRFVVDNCDALIALWDGKPASGPGGTSEIVEYARIAGRPLFWIHTDHKPFLTVENTAGMDVKSLQGLDAYNAERLLRWWRPLNWQRADLKQRADDQYRILGNHAEEAGFPLSSLRPILESLFPRFLRADLLAERYHSRYVLAGIVIYALAAFAVFAAAGQALFFPNGVKVQVFQYLPFLLIDKHWLLWGEVLAMLIVALIFLLGGALHAKWIDYRFLAERFRSALFLAAAGVNVVTLGRPHYFTIPFSSKDWMMRAFSAVWEQLPHVQNASHPYLATHEKPHLDNLKQFLLSAWIEDQLTYHKGAVAEHERLHNKLWVVGIVVFGLAMLVAMLHALAIPKFQGERIDHVFSFLNIFLPALASAIAAIRMHGEHERIAERSEEMVRVLEQLKAQMLHERHYDLFTQLVAEAEQTMFHENQDWRALFRSRRLEPAG